jgi:hypothetical protein
MASSDWSHFRDLERTLRLVARMERGVTVGTRSGVHARQRRLPREQEAHKEVGKLRWAIITCTEYDV